MSRVITGVLLVALGCHGAWDGSISSDVDQGGQPWKSFKSCRRMYFGVRTLNMTKTWNVVKEGNVECKASGDPPILVQRNVRISNHDLVTHYLDRLTINTCFAGVDHGESYPMYVRQDPVVCQSNVAHRYLTIHYWVEQDT
ncbi:hypothetical protein AAMO2058_001450700 [Amorphochlora amoebiformis]